MDAGGVPKNLTLSQGFHKSEKVGKRCNRLIMDSIARMLKSDFQKRMYLKKSIAMGNNIEKSVNFKIDSENNSRYYSGILMKLTTN